MKTTEEIKPLPEHVDSYVRKNTAFNMFGLLNLSTLRAVTRTNLSNAELKKRITHKYANSFVNNLIEFNGCDKYEMREFKENGSYYFKIVDTDTDKEISNSFLSKNIPSGWGKVENYFIKSKKKYEFAVSYKDGVFFTKHLNENYKNKK